LLLILIKYINKYPERIFCFSVLSSDLIYVILFPHLLLIFYWKGCNAYGCITSFFLGCLFRVLGKYLHNFNQQTNSLPHFKEAFTHTPQQHTKIYLNHLILGNLKNLDISNWPTPKSQWVAGVPGFCKTFTIVNKQDTGNDIFIISMIKLSINQHFLLLLHWKKLTIIRISSYLRRMLHFNLQRDKNSKQKHIKESRATYLLKREHCFQGVNQD